jgi:GT2 family glycosyltransferase
VIRRAINGGFGATVTDGVAAARGAVLCLCNNDLVVQAGFFRGLLDPMVEAAGGADGLLTGSADATPPSTGCVVGTSARTEDARGHANHACMRGVWRRGRMHLHWREAALPGQAQGEPMETHFVQGGAAAIRADAWHAVGGFDARFNPGYWEDYDLSHRLRARGWRLLYTPAARAFHLGSVSMKSRHGAGRVRDLQERNRLLFEMIHAPRHQAGWRQAAGVARDVIAEWWRGGPFHLTRGLRLAAAMPPLGPPQPRCPVSALGEELYRAQDIAGFVPVE